MEVNSSLISFIIINRIITIPAILVMAAISLLPLLVNTLSNITSMIPAPPILKRIKISSINSSTKLLKWLA